MKSPDSPQATRTPLWREQLKRLVEQQRGKLDSEWKVCKRLAPKLSVVGKMKRPWSPNYLLGLLHGSIDGTPSPIFRDAVESMLNGKKARIRKPSHRVYTAFENEDEAKLVTSLSAPDRRDALLNAAKQKG